MHRSKNSPTKKSRDSFAEEMNETLEAPVEAVESSAEAVSNSDIVITATNSPKPVFDGDLLEPGTHVTTMGQYHPKKQEVDATTIARSTYVVDLAERLQQDAGAYIAALEAGAIDDDHLHAELGSVVAGTAPGRQSEDEITLFDSGGTAIETVAAAKLLYDRATEVGRGESIEFAPASEAFIG